MSQAGKIITSGVGPGGPVLTLTGNDLVAVGPNAGNINIVGADGVVVTGNAGTNTLTITNGQVDTVQTVGAVTVTLGTFPITNNTVVFLESKIIGAYESAINWVFGTSLMATSRKQGAAAPIIVEGVVDERARARTAGTDQAVNATYVVSGNNIIIQVTGEAGTTINWKSVTTVLTQTVP